MSRCAAIPSAPSAPAASPGRGTWSSSKSIIPLLFGGVLVTGFVGALIPEEMVASWVGGDSLKSNLVASVIGGMWYFATLTEIPILEALLGLGMGRGPALALLLAGPALSLPSIAVIYSVIGAKKTFVFCLLVVILSAVVGSGCGQEAAVPAGAGSTGSFLTKIR